MFWTQFKTLSLAVLLTTSLLAAGLGAFTRDGSPPDEPDPAPTVDPPVSTASPPRAVEPQVTPGVENPLIGQWELLTLASEIDGKTEWRSQTGLTLPIRHDSLDLPVLTGQPGEPIHLRPRRRYRINPNAEPPTIDIVSSDDNSTWMPGIYRLEGDTLTICYEPETGQRPTTFTGESGIGGSLLILRRIRPPVPPSEPPSPAPAPIADLAETPSPTAEATKNELTGTWQLLSKQVGDESATTPEGQIAVFGENVITESRFPDQLTQFRLDTTHHPAWIDLIPRFAPYNPPQKRSSFGVKSFPGVYERRGDRLTLVFAEPGADRPSSLDAPLEPGVRRITFRYLGPALDLPGARADITPPWDEVIQRDDQKAIQGDWTVSFIAGGVTARPQMIPSPLILVNDASAPVRTVKITADSFPILAITEPTSDRVALTNHAHYRLDTSQAPKAIDLRLPSLGAAPQSTLHGIYHFEGDTLMVCYGSIGVARPKSFTPVPQSQTLVVLRRYHPAPPTPATSPAASPPSSTEPSPPARSPSPTEPGPTPTAAPTPSAPAPVGPREKASGLTPAITEERRREITADLEEARLNQQLAQDAHGGRPHPAPRPAAEAPESR